MKLTTQLLAVAALICVASGARAHDFWSNGEPVNKSTKAHCCGQQDCYQIFPMDTEQSDGFQTADGKKTTRTVKGRPDPYHVEGGWITVDNGGVQRFIPDDHAQPSPDGNFWQCEWGSEGGLGGWAEYSGQYKESEETPPLTEGHIKCFFYSLSM